MTFAARQWLSSNCMSVCSRFSIFKIQGVIHIEAFTFRHHALSNNRIVFFEALAKAYLLCKFHQNWRADYTKDTLAKLFYLQYFLRSLEPYPLT